MGLRVAETPESVIARTRKENTLAWVIISRNSQARRSGGPCFSLFIPIFIAMLAPFSCGVIISL